jgi:L-threonylcarbamoyladenylate synthase
VNSGHDIGRAVEILRRGGLVAFPTETVYGLGADATNPHAIDLIYRTKGRPATNPLIVHVADVETARRFVADWPEFAQKLAERFWPGPLTLVLPKRLSGSNRDVIPDSATAGRATLAIRVPGHPVALELLRAFGGPLAAPSANKSTRVSATTAQHVRDEFPDSIAAGGTRGEPSLILDGGPCEVGIESTVLDLTTSSPTILRPGRSSIGELGAILGAVALREGGIGEATPAKSPGQHEIHYAPVTAAYRFETSQRGLIHPDAADGRENGMVVLSPLVILKKWGSIIAMPREPSWYAREIYGILRELDDMGLAAIYLEMPPDTPDWAAVRDRLLRATKPFPAGV